MNSKTSMSLFSVWITSCKRTMLGCLSSFMIEISRMAVDGVPSSGSVVSDLDRESVCAPKWISFSATIELSTRLRPCRRQTGGVGRGRTL